MRMSGGARKSDCPPERSRRCYPVPGPRSARGGFDEVRFARDSLLEGAEFELPVPRAIALRFRDETRGVEVSGENGSARFCVRYGL
jgi:hypothetical protein